MFRKEMPPVRNLPEIELWIEPPKRGLKAEKKRSFMLNSWQVSAVR